MARLVLLLAIINCAPTAVRGQSTDSLVRRIEALERRVSDLEALIAKYGIAPSGNQGVPAWRRLRRGMNMGAVRALLGEPESMRAVDSFTFWHYRSGGVVGFDGDNVSRWWAP